MIEAIQVNKKFGALQVLNKVSFKGYLGECIALVGPNGCGKTTLIKCILGMVRPDSGTLLCNNTNIASGWEYRSQIGYMPQIGRYPENMKIGQVLDMLRDIRQKKNGLDEDLIHAYNLEKLYDKRMGTLSGGTMQKVSAAIAFLFQPKILILDEPTAGLDPLSSEILKDKIQTEKKNGKLIFITSHILSELDELVSDLIYMQDGNIIFHKNLEMFKAEMHETKLSKAIAQFMTPSE
jgi:Cu-processing system ATP-binding protein